MILYGAILFFATLTIDLWTDYHRYLSGKQINHVRGVWLRCIGLIPSGVALCLTKNFDPVWKVVAPAGLMIFLFYWILFNGIFNVLIGQKWQFLGSTSKLDIFERTHYWVSPVKWAVAVASFTIYVILAT